MKASARSSIGVLLGTIAGLTAAGCGPREPYVRYSGKADQLITPEEYTAKRAEILKEL